MTRAQPNHLQWPLTPEQVEAADEMLYELYSLISELDTQISTLVSAAASPVASSGTVILLPYDSDREESLPTVSGCLPSSPALTGDISVNGTQVTIPAATGHMAVGPVPTVARRLSVSSAQQVIASFLSTGGVNAFLRLFNSADGETGGLQIQTALGGVSTVISAKDFGFSTAGAYPITFAPNGVEGGRFTHIAKLFIGLTATDSDIRVPKVYIIGDGSPPLVEAERGPHALCVQGRADVNGDNRTVMSVYDTTEVAIGNGPSIMLAGKVNNTGTHDNFGFISGVKETVADDGSSSGALELGTRAAGSSPTTWFRLSSSGKVGIQTRLPLVNLHVETRGNNASTEHAYFLGPEVVTSGFNNYIVIGKAISAGNSLVVGHQYNSTGANAFGWLSVAGDAAGVGLVIRKGGHLGAGVTAPTAALHLQAGTATAASAPLKFTSGVSLTAAEAGALEFTTDDYFATITTGAARKGFVLNDGANLTSGKYPKASTNGRLVDGPTPLAGTKVYYVSDTSGGAVNRKLTFTDGILTSET